MDTYSRQDEFWPLATATSHVYREVMGMWLWGSEVPETNAIVHDVAHALANVAPIYWLDTESGTYREIEPVALLFGVFERGATVLRTPREKYQRLAIRRADMRTAITILKNAGVRFSLPPDASHTYGERISLVCYPAEAESQV